MLIALRFIINWSSKLSAAYWVEAGMFYGICSDLAASESRWSDGVASMFVPPSDLYFAPSALCCCEMPRAALNGSAGSDDE